MDQKTRTGQAPQQNRDQQENDLKKNTPLTPDKNKTEDTGQQQQPREDRELGKEPRKA